MNNDPSFENPRARRSKIRKLGFDPEQLTSAEQLELLELDACFRSSFEQEWDVTAVVT